MRIFLLEGKDVVCSFMLVSNAAVLTAVNMLAPENYMDEPFHVPQTQHFCSGNFRVWDPKITTFPGLYVVSAAIMRVYAWLGTRLCMDPSAAYAPCSTASLRAINTSLWVLCFYTLHAILQQQQQQQQKKHLQHQQPPPCYRNHKAQQHVAERSDPNQVQSRQKLSSTSACNSSSLISSLISHLRSPSSPCLWAATLSFFPLHWFYSVLFYTDVGAHLFLLACQLLSMQQRYGFAAAAGAAAVMFRQTNAVWVAFVLGAAALRIARDCQVQQEQDACAPQERTGVQGDHACAPQEQAGVQGDHACAPQEQSGVQGDHACTPQEQTGVQGDLLNTVSAEQLERRPNLQSGKHDQQLEQQQQQQEQEQEQGPDAAGLAGVLLTLEVVWRFRERILRLLWPLVLVPATFAAFLVVNKGVTVGDRAAHRPVHHFAQLVYFGLFCAALLQLPLTATVWLSTLLHIKSNTQSFLVPQNHRPPQTPPQTRRLGFIFPWSQPGRLAWLALTFIVTGLCLIALHSAPSPHPYLLADNRHFTFYIWRRLLAPRGWLHALVLAAAAAFAWVTMIRGLAAAQQQQHGALWVCGYLAAVALVLVPAWLLEFRYFTTPFLLLAIHVPRPTRLQAYAALCCYTAINAVTLYLFLWKPFTWADGTEARFMW